MIFSELYSAYYKAVAAVLCGAFSTSITEKDIRQIIEEHAFSESVLTILPSLKSGKWPLLKEDLTPVLHHTPTMPLTMLEKRWLKSLADDPRLKLFDITMPELEGIEPLFTKDDYRIYDQYTDGDPYEDKTYIKNFRTIRTAIREERPVWISMVNRYGKNIRVRFYPKGFEYSLKDDKIRVIADGCKFRQFNLGRIRTCEFYTGNGPWNETPEEICMKDLTLTITDERNALERVMLHFAHFEKQAERIDDDHYRLRLKYDAGDETELVIRILSFGPLVKVEEPESFVNLIKERLKLQKSCKLN